MSEQSPATILRRWFEEVWNEGRYDSITALFAADAVAYALDEAGRDAHGPEAFRAFLQNFRRTFSGVHFTIHDVIESGDLAAGRWTARATHSGPGMGHPTGETLTITGMTMARVRNGQIVEGWNEWDRLRLATACRVLVPAA